MANFVFPLLALLALSASLGLSAAGLVALATQFRARLRPMSAGRHLDSAAPVAGAAASSADDRSGAATPLITLVGVATLPAEPGVLLNTLWEHLPHAECQAGECGGCRLRLLEGEVRWIRDPIVPIDRKTHILACSCVAAGSVRCALPEEAGR